MLPRRSPVPSFRSTAAGRRNNVNIVDNRRHRAGSLTLHSLPNEVAPMAITKLQTPHAAKARGNGASLPAKRPALPGQVVLVLQGGGALGAYQVGVYEAL